MSGEKPEFEPLEPVVTGIRIPAADKKKLREARKQAESELRGQLMAADKLLQGQTIAQLAQNYSISPSRASDELDLAYAKGFKERFEKVILDKLVPASLAVYEAHLSRGNLEAARDLLFGLGILRKDHKGPSEAPGASIDTIEAYRVIRKTETPS